MVMLVDVRLLTPSSLAVANELSGSGFRNTFLLAQINVTIPGLLCKAAEDFTCGVLRSWATKAFIAT